jgi:polyvinyl alcohol dehydrogenase (cytochrome)
VLEQRCTQCHGTVLREGAPMRLLRGSDFAMDSGGQTIGQIASFRIADPARPMPPPPYLPLPPAEIEILRSWLVTGAPTKPDGCGVFEPMGAAGASGAGNLGGASGGGLAGAPGGAGGGFTVTGGTAGAEAGGAVNGGLGGAGNSAGAAGSAGAGPVGADWSMFGADLANSRSNPTSKISPASFGTFHRVWNVLGPAVTSTPAVVDGVVYFAGWDARVRAVHAADGSPVWTAIVPHLVDSSPAVTADRVVVADNNGFVHALDRLTGGIVWSKPAETVGLPHLWSSPIVIPDAGLVVVGVASAEESNAAGKPFTFRGSMAALDLVTGEKRWQFYTTTNDFTSGPGVGIWSTAAVDPVLKLLYIGTGNGYSAPAGKNSDSLLAIRYETGDLEWGHQFQAADVFEVYTASLGIDADVGAAANVFSAGGMDLVGVGCKNGVYYALDRKTGVQVWQRRVSTGSTLGGVMGASAYANGVVFVAGNERTAGKTTLMAINALDGAVLWTYSATSTTYASLATANGVVYLGTTAGTLHAVEAATGRLLWSDAMPNGIGGGPSVGDSLLFAPWGFVLTFLNGTNAGQGGLIAYGP